ncbi:MAG TPA: SMP-30/gluconolactonase/LRE family protein [Candidatus Baltobacteraceae bacterium]|nr:SMP-30/gluconolactonase/LRE family protein [Candidatus Baltobacteraceae bacterium]
MRVLTEGWTFLESPRWRDGRFWVSDFYTGSIVAVALDGTAETVARVAGQPSGLGWLPNGDLLVVSMRDRSVMRCAEGALSPYADLAGVASGYANDMVVAADGTAYVGNFGFDLMAGEPVRPATLARVAPDGSVYAAAGGLLFPNGMAIVADGSALIVAETFAQRLTAFSIASDGTLSGRRTWAQLERVSPDGIALDAEGCMWVADATHRRALRVRPGGAIAEERTYEDAGIFACALGGPEGTTLALCVAPTFHEAAARAARASRLVVCEVDVPRAGLP